MHVDQSTPTDNAPTGTYRADGGSWEAELHLIFAQARMITPPLLAARHNNPSSDPALRGTTLFFTGLSGAGKSTIASMIFSRIERLGGRHAALLDGDLVRRHLSSDLGFSRGDRDINIRRIGYVAAQITRRGGIAICAAIAPYDKTRKEVRAMVRQFGEFALIHVATPLEVCEQRDPKGLYAKARCGALPQFTGVSDPYEPPDDAESVIDTTHMDAEAAAQQVLCVLTGTARLANLGYRPFFAGFGSSERGGGAGAP